MDFVEKQIEQFNYLAKKFKLELLVLFGSRAKGEARVDSDWDFAFLSRKELTTKEEIGLYQELQNLVEESVDLINLGRESDPYLRYEIIMNCQILFERKQGTYSELQDKVWFEYQDFLPNYALEKEISELKTKELLLKVRV